MNIVIKEDIKKGLRNLGINTGFHLGGHSSLQSLGKVKEGAITVINTLLEAVGNEETVVMPTFSTNRIEFELTSKEREIGLLWKYKILLFNPKENES